MTTDNNTCQNFILDENSLSEIVLAVQNYAISMKIDDSSAKRYSFLIDNALDRWMQNGGRGSKLKVIFGRHLFMPFVSVEMIGKRIEPYPIRTEDFGEGGNDISVFTSHLPAYEYRDGINCITLNLKRGKNMVRRIGIVVALAALVGMLGNSLIPDSTQEEILLPVMNSIIDMFFNLLRCIAGPMVFLSVVWGICGIGDSRLFGRIGKRVLLFSVGITAFGSLIGALAFPFIGNGIDESTMTDGAFSSILEMILGIVPSSVVEPFSTGNIIQIIFLAIAFGIALITMGGKVGNLVNAVEQLNNVVQHLMGVIVTIVPYIVFLLITKMIWGGSLSIILSMWKFFVALIAAFLLITIIICVITSVKHSVGLVSVVKKNFSTFIITLATASSAASFKNNLDVAQNKYGIADEMAEFSIPLGMIMHKPITACYNLLLAIYFAASYAVPCSISWLIIGVIICTAVAIATPPIPGGSVVGYALVFSQLGIPEEALAIVLVLDVITDFIVTAFECYNLPISLVNIAGKTEQLNSEILKK